MQPMNEMHFFFRKQYNSPFRGLGGGVVRGLFVDENPLFIDHGLQCFLQSVSL
jgi:hypothetical protein